MPRQKRKKEFKIVIVDHSDAEKIGENLTELREEGRRINPFHRTHQNHPKGGIIDDAGGREGKR